MVFSALGRFMVRWATPPSSSSSAKQLSVMVVSPVVWRFGSAFMVLGGVTGADVP